MTDLISLSKNSVFYIGLHNQKHTVLRPWAIMELTKYGPKQFDVYFSREQAEVAAKVHGLTIIVKPE